MQMQMQVQVQRRKRVGTPGDPSASAAVLEIVDADEPPLRCFFGTAPRGRPLPPVDRGPVPRMDIGVQTGIRRSSIYWWACVSVSYCGSAR
ncbi:hypothetical protein [Streptomyces tauricus]|uniref:hypothetical protein n=1 Tax=Streptomyces tauricus TaxID=68274 RepID=UPI003828C510